MARINHLWTFAHRALLVSLIAAPTVAQIPCEDDPYGELPDCSFEQDPFTDWTLVEGSFFGPTLGDGDDPHRTGSGSAEVHAVEAGPDFYSSTVASECFPVTPAWQSSYGAWVKAIDFGELVDCYVERFAYEDSTCSNLLGSSGTDPVNANPLGWEESAGTGELAGPFARLEINCSSTDDFEIKIDDAFSVRPESCTDDPNNVLPNCSFEEEAALDGWTLALGDSFDQSTAPALIGNGSAVVDAFDVAGHAAIIWSCAPLSAAVQGVSFGGNFRLLAGAAQCRASLFWYESDDCGGTAAGAVDGPTVLSTEVGWFGSSDTAGAAVGASAGLFLECYGTYPYDDFTVQFDEAFILVQGPIFSDGFETGDTTSWQ